MRALSLCLLVAAARAHPQKISFGDTSSSSSGSEKAGVNTRLGLLATQLGLDPTATQGGSQEFSSQGSSLTSSSGQAGASAPLIDGSGGSASASGRIPAPGSSSSSQLSGSSGAQQCCCAPASQVCQDPFGGGDDLVGGGFIDPRLKNNTFSSSGLRSGLGSISTRIVNRPVASTNAQQNSCPVGQQTCCYDASIDLSVFGIQCINPQSANQVSRWPHVTPILVSDWSV